MGKDTRNGKTTRQIERPKKYNVLSQWDSIPARFSSSRFLHFAVPPFLGPQASEKDSKKGIKKGNDVISPSLHCELLWNGWSAVDY